MRPFPRGAFQRTLNTRLSLPWRRKAPATAVNSEKLPPGFKSTVPIQFVGESRSKPSTTWEVETTTVSRSQAATTRNAGDGLAVGRQVFRSHLVQTSAHVEGRTEDVHLHTPALQVGTHFLLTLETIVFLFHLLSATSKPFSSLSMLAHAARLVFFLQKTGYINSLLLSFLLLYLEMKLQ